ncbi:MAG: hypothetical protein GKR96_13195 [Gammaproteobacteria bacterium]|nr:hypothetical protein [Gammaproteobacteria bacterium]
MVEFGVGDGRSCNCRLLAEVLGWEGRFWEYDDSEFDKLQQRYSHFSKVQCGQEIMSSENINSIFEKYRVPHRFGVLSMDVDGQDFWIWKALDNAYQPDVIVMEFNSALDQHQALVEEEGLEVGLPLGKTWGASLKAMLQLGNEKGYRLVHIDMAGVNLFFVREQTIIDNNLNIKGIISDRSPNYGLRGQNHPDTVLYNDQPKVDRPQKIISEH